MASKVRLPYHRAPFYFAPEFLATPDQWQASIEKLVNDVLRREGIDAAIISGSAYTLAVMFGRAEFHIDALGGTFRLVDAGDGYEGLPICAVPRYFFGDLHRAELFSETFWPIVESIIQPFVAALMSGMRLRFEEALRTGKAQIEAKVGSRRAAFEMIAPQDRPHIQLFERNFGVEFGLKANNLDDAAYDTGERLYSYGIAVVDGDNEQDRPDGDAKPTRSKGTGKGRKRGPGAPHRIRWDLVDPIIKEVRQRSSWKTKTAVFNEVMERKSELGPNPPGKTQLKDRIRNIFSD